MLMRLTYLALAWTTVSCDCGSDDVLTEPIFHFEATLSGSSVVPPVVTPASGTATFLLDNEQDKGILDFTITVSNLPSADSANLHVAISGENGPAHAKLCGPCATVSSGVLARGTISGLSRSAVISMRAFGTYIEIRNASGPVLRGQLRVAAGPSPCQ
jgi:hypothetical protein